jgi:hypothetical protein
VEKDVFVSGALTLVAETEKVGVLGHFMYRAVAIAEKRLEEQRRLPNEIPFTDLHNPVVQAGLQIWQQARGTRKSPPRAEITPRMLSGLLRNTILVRVLIPGEEYELRIVGDSMVQAHGRSLQGMSTSEIDLLLPGHGRQLRASYNAVCDRHQPLASRGWHTREADDHTLFQETVFLPLSNDERNIDHILVFGAHFVPNAG